MPKKTGFEEAIRLAIEKLRGVDLAGRCALLGLPEPQKNTLKFHAFGSDLELRLPGFQLFPAGSDKPVKSTDRILVLHYLLCDLPLNNTGELISFRELQGGRFFWEPFLSRSVRPLMKRIGNNLELLKKNLDSFDWEPVSLGDFAARIHVLGKVYLTLVYRVGDEEFPPAADLLFDACVKRVYNAEDAAVLAGRICLNLM
ncbi:MAG: DUF3786 domain-containing protein [Candidatus Aminicenantes bacterium]|nr:DUF3786 domain-containing protein [Candidatus Aminicenantes bacterium]